MIGRQYKRRPGAKAPGRSRLSEESETVWVKIGIPEHQRFEDLKEASRLGFKTLAAFYRHIRHEYYKRYGAEA